MNTNNKTYVADCKISKPIFYPNQQHVGFNGFAFSGNMGIIHQVNANNNVDWESWLGTQN